MGWANNPSRKQESLFSIPIIQMGVRVYLPTLGRFLSVDPVIGGTANPYVYVGDPVNDSDYSGRFSFWNLRDWMRKLATPAKIGQGVRSVASGAWNYVRNNPAEVGSMVPGFGTPFDLFLAGREAKKGNTAGTALNLIGLIPFAGDIAKGGGKAANIIGDTQKAYKAQDAFSLRYVANAPHPDRGYQGSSLLIQEIISKPPNLQPYHPHLLSWGVEGTMNGSKGIYQLTIDPTRGEITHFMFTSGY